MKKEYIVPSVKHVTLNLQSMLAASASEVPMKPTVPGTPATKERDENLWRHEWE